MGHNGDGDAAVWTSEDGVTWRSLPLDESIINDSRMFDVVDGENGFLAVGADTTDKNLIVKVWASEDGINWKSVPHQKDFESKDDLQMRAITGYRHGYVAVGYDGLKDSSAAWTSEDGLNWQLTSSIDHNLDQEGMYDVAASENVIVAVGWEKRDSNVNAAIWISEINDIK